MAEHRFGRGSTCTVKMMTWRMCYPIEPACVPYKEPGIHLHFSPADAQDVRRAYQALLAVTGATAALASLLGALQPVLFAVLGELTKRPDGSMDVKLSEHAWQINDHPAIDPRFWGLLPGNQWMQVVSLLTSLLPRGERVEAPPEAERLRAEAEESRGELVSAKTL
jgi:hypothetical protein